MTAPLCRDRSATRPTFVLKLEGRPGTPGIRALRWLLKRLLRQHGLRALDLRELDPGRR
jgi:hypothetical protein